MSSERWREVRAVVRAVGDRFAELVATCPPDARATADWSVADAAAHVRVISSLYVHLVQPDRTGHPFPNLEKLIATTTVDTVAHMNALTLRQLPERRPLMLADRLREDVGAILSATEGRAPTEVVPWLGDSRVPLDGLLAHLVNEFLIHGRDIARAIPARRADWPIPAPEAALFFELFLTGVTRCGYGRLLDDGDRPRARRIAVEFSSRYTTAVTFVLHHGRVSVEAPRPGADVRLWFDPPALNLMLFGRISKPRAVLTGKLVIRGPRPWLLPTFLRTMRLPS